MNNFEKKKIIPFTNKQQELNEKGKNLLHMQKTFEHKYTNDKIIIKLKTIVTILVNTEVLHILNVV